MEFKTVGDRSNPAILFFHAMGVTGESSMPVAEKMVDSLRRLEMLETIKVTIVPFCQVNAEHAYKEGEDDRSLHKWREVHRQAFAPDYAAVGLDFDENGACVLEEFEVVYPQI